MKKIKLTAGDVTLELELCENSTAEAIYNALPLKGKADHWGEECHFSTDLAVDNSNSNQQVVEIGDVVFSPESKVISIGFGPTLWSEDEEVRYEHPVTVWAKCRSDASSLIFIPNDEIITIEAM